MRADEPHTDNSPVYHLHRYILGWCLFDFTTSVLMANGALYFPSWIVVQNGISSLSFNSCIIISTILALLMGPILGTLTDSAARPILALRVTTTVMFLCAFTLYLLSQFVTLSQIRSIAVLGAFTILFTSYQIGIVFYNSLLQFLRRFGDERTVSGLGIAANWSGAVFGILFVLPFAQGIIPLPSSPGSEAAFLVASLLFLFLSLVSFFLLPDDKAISLNRPLSGLVEKPQGIFLSVIKNRQILWFLAGYMLFMDAILTVQNNLAIYMTISLELTSGSQALMFLLLFVTAAAGGVLSTLLLRRFDPYVVLTWNFGIWIFLFPMMASVPNFSFQAICIGIAGFLFGIAMSVTRVAYVRVIPVSQAGKYFGFYNSFERSASILGPLAWGFVTTSLSSVGQSISLRVALGTMTLFVLLAIVALRYASPGKPT